MAPSDDVTPASDGGRLRLLPSLRAAEYAGAAYFFDVNVGSTPVVSVPIQRVKRPYADVVTAWRSANPANDFWPLSRIPTLLPDDLRRRALELMVQRGYFEWDLPARETAGDPRDRMSGFLGLSERQYFHRPRLFNLPEEIDDQAAQLVFAGVPLASTSVASGTVLGPTALRVWTARAGVWFDVFERGVYSEVGAENSLPEILCRGIVLSDCGDLGQAARTPAELFSHVRAFVDRCVERGQPAIFAGGDHAMLFPIVDAYLRHCPDLALVHLDAHNDLFYIDDVRYNHAAPLSSLLLATTLTDVFSLGLRTDVDDRVTNLSRLLASPDLAARVHPYSIGTLKRMLSEPTRFDALIAAIGPERPCYLSIDLDILSASIAGRVSTPAGPGLDWWELLEVVRRLSRRLPLIACDVVELDVLANGNGEAMGRMLASLLFQLIHGLVSQRSLAFRR